MPEGAAGRVLDGLPRLRAVAVEFGEVLFRLVPVGAVDDAGRARGTAAPGDRAGAELAANTRAIVVADRRRVLPPTLARRRRRSSRPGSRVRLGQPVGLVEVMKTFNQILYDGPGFPEEAEVVEVRVEDDQEVSAGQVLIVVR